MSHILLIDDEEDIRYLLSQALGRLCAIREAADGTAGLQAMHDCPPDLVITDLHMPGVSGLDILAAAHEQDPTLPVMIITATGSLDTAVEALRRGAYDYIQKPFDDLAALRNTVSRALEARLLRQENARLVADLKQADAFKSHLLRTVSHDFKNLLTVIIGYGRLAQISPEPAQITESLERIVNTSRQMAVMAEDLSTYGQIGGHNLILNQETISLLTCAREAASLVLFDPQVHHVHLPDDAITAWADRHRTTQILTNLLANAVKYSPQGGNIFIEANPSGDCIQVKVSDSGLGIPQAEVARLFAPFFRLARDVSNGIPGTGLGLTIAKSLVELQGGTLWCESQEGVGSTFIFTLPARGGS